MRREIDPDTEGDAAHEPADAISGAETETTRAPTRPKPIPRREPDRSFERGFRACAVEIGGFISVKTAASTIIATPVSHITDAIHRLARES